MILSTVFSILLDIHHFQFNWSEIHSKITIYQSRSNAILERKAQWSFPIKGINPKIEKIHLKTLTPEIDLILLFIQQGWVKSVRSPVESPLKSSTICYFITYHKKTKKYYLSMGPSYAHKQYAVRDLDQDKEKIPEILFNFPHSDSPIIYKLVHKKYWIPFL